MKKIIALMALLLVIVQFKDGTERTYERESAWIIEPMLFLYDSYDEKGNKFVGDYDAVKLEDVRSYRKVSEAPTCPR